MITMIPTALDEETPLLGDQQPTTVGRISEREFEAATLAGSSSGRAPNTEGRTNVNGGSQSDVVKKTPLPWAQFSITLFLLLAEHLTPQVISPVSSSADFPPFPCLVISLRSIKR